MLEQAKHIYQNTSPVKAIALGVGAVILAPTVFSLLKPVAKASIKAGLVLYDKTKGTLAEAGEVLGDIVAEAKAEVIAEHTQKETAIAQLKADSHLTSES